MSNEPLWPGQYWLYCRLDNWRTNVHFVVKADFTFIQNSSGALLLESRYLGFYRSQIWPLRRSKFCGPLLTLPHPSVLKVFDWGTFTSLIICPLYIIITCLIPDEDVGFINWHSSSHTMAMGLTGPLAEMRTRYHPGDKNPPLQKKHSFIGAVHKINDYS
jgi:hypothetical protein